MPMEPSSSARSRRGFSRWLPGAAFPRSSPHQARTGIHVMPSFLPDGRRFLYVAIETRDRKAEARLATLDGSAVHRFPLDDGGRVLFMPSADDDASGHLYLRARKHSCRAELWTSRPCLPLGEPVVIADDIGGDASQAPGAFSVTASGALAYLSGDVWQDSQLTWFNRDGARWASSARWASTTTCPSLPMRCDSP